MQMSKVFVYGSLRAHRVREALLRKTVRTVDAVLPDFSVRPLRDRVYPGLVSYPGGSAVGMVLFDIIDTDLDILDDFEDEYDRVNVTVITSSDCMPERVQAFTYLWRGLKPHQTDSTAVVKEGPSWQYEQFCAAHLDAFVTNTVQYRESYDTRRRAGGGR